MVTDEINNAPVLLYLKVPAQTIAELEARYEDGGELGWYAWVEELKNFAYWDVDSETWKEVNPQVHATTQTISTTDYVLGIGKKWSFQTLKVYFKNYIFPLVQTLFATHTSNISNPHSVTKAQVGLGNVENTSDTNKPVSTAQKAYIDEQDGIRDLAIQSEASTREDEDSSLQDQITALANGSPKGSYADEAALILADPDHTYTYATIDSGKWYYYSTTLSAWTIGGDYQSPLEIVGELGTSESKVINQKVVSEELAKKLSIVAQTLTAAQKLQTRTNINAQSQVIVNVKDFGALGNGVADDTAAITAALQAGSSIYFPDGTYYIPNRLTIPTGKSICGNNKYNSIIYGRINVNSNSLIQNLTFMVDDDFMAYDGNGIVENTAQTNNVVFDNCIFKLLNTTTVIATLGLFTFNFGIDNLKILNCDFTVPSISMNAIKFVQNLSSNITHENIVIDKCNFVDIGRIAIEMWSALSGDNTIASINNVKIINNTFENIGIVVNNVQGIGISLSGYVFNSKINDNSFINVKGIGVEIVRYHTGTIVSNNSFYECDNGTISPITATLDEGGVGYVKGVSIQDNILLDSNGFYLSSINESVIKGNIFINSTFGEIGGQNNLIIDNQISSLKAGETNPFYLNNLIKSTIKGNIIISATVSLTSLFTLAGTSTQNIFIENNGMLLESNAYVLPSGSNTINKFSDANTNIVLNNFRRTENKLTLHGYSLDVTWNLNGVTIPANSFVENGYTFYCDYSTNRKIFEIATPCNLNGCIAMVNLTGMNSYKIRITNPTDTDIILAGESYPNSSPASDLNWVWSILIKYI